MDRLLELLRERSFRQGTFTLASGRTSDFFIDCKPTVLSAEGHALVGPALLREIRSLAPNVVAVAGVVLGGCSLASAVSLASWPKEPLDAIYVRKQPKDHGSQQRIEGAARLSAGAPIALVEDTVTTGGSTLRAAEALKNAGFVVAAVASVVDRREGASEAFAAAGLPFRSLYTRGDFIPEPS
ncbi:MAG: orotate phosphoribosyltransferase [Myxococcota bacterium]